MNTSTCVSPCSAVQIFDEMQMYSISQAARRGAISRSFLYEQMLVGNLPYVKRGATRRLVGKDLNAYLSDGYCPARPE